MGKQKVVSLAVEFPYCGKTYKGVSLKDGVSLGFKPAACGVNKTQLTFENGDRSPIAFLENVSGADIESSEVPAGYLVIHPAGEYSPAA